VGHGQIDRTLAASGAGHQPRLFSGDVVRGHPPKAANGIKRTKDASRLERHCEEGPTRTTYRRVAKDSKPVKWLPLISGSSF